MKVRAGPGGSGTEFRSLSMEAPHTEMGLPWFDCYGGDIKAVADAAVPRPGLDAA